MTVPRVALQQFNFGHSLSPPGDYGGLARLFAEAKPPASSGRTSLPPGDAPKAL